jgi:hypothetical protein
MLKLVIFNISETLLFLCERLNSFFLLFYSLYFSCSKLLGFLLYLMFLLFQSIPLSLHLSFIFSFNYCIAILVSLTFAANKAGLNENYLLNITRISPISSKFLKKYQTEAKLKTLSSYLFKIT